MKFFRKNLRKLRDLLFGSSKTPLEYNKALYFIGSAKLKRFQNDPIHVLFVCHMPALWNMFESVYKAMIEDSAFSATVVALPYSHITLPKGQWKDDGVFDFLKGKGVNVIKGFNVETNEWLAPKSLNPDYVFFQTPYNIFSSEWAVEQVSICARVCYIPYATCLFGGEVDEIFHHVPFFRFVNIFFKESRYNVETFATKFKGESWFEKTSVVLSGSPKLDYFKTEGELSGSVWKHGIQNGVIRILWTPRWYTSEGTSHFFDYKDYFMNFCEMNLNIDFAFRPHPLCLQNFLTTGELTVPELNRMEAKYERSSNMTLDKSAGYLDTFLTSDILISDISSMLLEFLVTGKPIIYTHRVDTFNDLGRKLSEGFYWVENSTELQETLDMLMSGKDPLKFKREELIREHIYMPEGGAGVMIKDTLQADYVSTTIDII